MYMWAKYWSSRTKMKLDPTQNYYIVDLTSNFSSGQTVSVSSVTDNKRYFSGVVEVTLARVYQALKVSARARDQDCNILLNDF